jgi:hypothetical protein
VTQFFLAGLESDSEGAEAAYSELRERSQIAVGSAASPRRIFKLDCRFEGCDCEIEVGRPMPNDGEVTRPVHAVTDFS